ncbi:MAG: hypothetical protein C5B60_06855 [Chloroflexi bacterium]|nr:MAG: hypothetical protein C5B60_06855 [Chloroflexota bacterium]
MTLDDRASAGLGNLQNQMRQMGTGAPAAGMESLRRQGGEVTASIRGMSGAMNQAAAVSGVVGGAVGALALKAVDLGISFIGQATNFKGFTDAMIQLNQQSDRSATSMAQFKANVDVMRASGIEAGQAATMLNKFTATYADLQKGVSSGIRRDLLSGLRDEDRANMESLLTNIRGMSQTQALGAIKEYGEAIRAFHTARGQEERGTMAMLDFYAKMGVSGLENVRGKFFEVSEEQKKLYADRGKDADVFQEKTFRTSLAWERVTNSMRASLMNLLGVNQGMETMAGLAERIAARTEKFEGDIRKAKEAAKEVVPEEKPPEEETWGEFFRRMFDPREIARAENVAREQATFDIVGGTEPAEAIREAQSYLEMRRDVQDEAARQRRERGEGFLTEAEQLRRGYEPLTPAELAAAQPRLTEEEQLARGYPQQPIAEAAQARPEAVYRARPEELPPPEAPAAEVRAAEAQAAVAQQMEVPGLENVVGTFEDNTTATDASTEQQQRLADETKRLADTMEQQQQQPTEAAAQPGPLRRAWNWLTGRGQAEAAPAQRFDGGGDGLATQGIQINAEAWDRFLEEAPRSQNIEDRRHEDSVELSDALGGLTASVETRLSGLAPNLGRDGGQMQPVFFQPQQLDQPQPQQDIEAWEREAPELGPEASGRAEQVVTDKQFAKLLTTFMPGGTIAKLARGTMGFTTAGGIAQKAMGEGFAGESMLPSSGLTTGELLPALKGLLGGGQAAGDRGAEAMDHAAQALDRAAMQNVNVNGTGKISVDVNAPPGTRVAAEGEGLFKSTEISRQTQMMPAESGPLASTGVNAGGGMMG